MVLAAGGVQFLAVVPPGPAVLPLAPCEGAGVPAVSSVGGVVPAVPDSVDSSN